MVWGKVTAHRATDLAGTSVSDQNILASLWGPLLHLKKPGGTRSCPWRHYTYNFPSSGFPLPRGHVPCHPSASQAQAVVPPSQAGQDPPAWSSGSRGGPATRPSKAAAGNTRTPRGLRLPFPLTARAGRRKAEAAPLGGPAHRRGGAGRECGSRGQASGGAMAGAGRRGGAGRSFPGGGR